MDGLVDNLDRDESKSVEASLTYHEFEQGAPVLVLLVAAYAVDVYGAQFVDVVNGIDRPDVTYRINAWFVGTNLTLNLALVPTVGWYGAALATALSTAFRTALGFRAAGDVLNSLTVPVGVIARQAGAALVMAVALVPVVPRVPGGRVWTLALVGGGAAVYFLALLVLSDRVRRKVRMIAPVSGV